MAYYTALTAAWNAGGTPSGASGTAITAGMTTAQKIAAVNSWTLVVPQKAILQVTAIINAILPADYEALTALQLQEIAGLFEGQQQVDASPGTTIRQVFSDIFASKPTTLADLTALVSPFDNATAPWWSTPVAKGGGGLNSMVDLADAQAAGLS